MQSRAFCRSGLLLLTVWAAGLAAGADLRFRHHFIDRALPVSDALVGDDGLTALVDLDRDADLVSKPWGPRPWNGAGGAMHVDFLENLSQQPKPTSAGTTGSPSAEQATIALSGGPVTVKRVEALPYVESEYTRRFKFDSAENPKLRELRQRCQLDAVVAAGRDEFDRQVYLLDWVHHRFRKFGRPSIEAKGALEILQAIDQGHAFFCSQYAHVFVSAAASLGWIDRELALRRHRDPPGGGSSEHATTEVWSNQYRKWIMMDPTAKMYVEKDGIPLNAYEIRQEWFQRGGRDLVFVVGKERQRYRKADLPIFLGRFEGFGDLTVPVDELDKYGFIGYIPNTDLMDAGLDYGQMFIVQDRLCEGTRWHVRTVPANPAVDPYFPLNQAAVKLGSEQGKIVVRLQTLTPNFQAYEFRLDGGPWDSTKENLLWSIHPGLNHLEVRTVNRFGVYGPISMVQVEQ